MAGDNDNGILDRELRQKIMEVFLDAHTDVLTDQLQALYELLDVPSSKEVFMSLVLSMGIEALSTALVMMGRETAQKVIQEVFNQEFRRVADKSEHLRSMLTNEVVASAQQSMEKFKAHIEQERRAREDREQEQRFSKKPSTGFGQMADALKKAGFN